MAHEAGSEDSDLGTALVKWISTFSSKYHIEAKCQSMEDLADGVLPFELLSHLSPEFFDISKIQRKPKGLSVVANVKRLVECLEKCLDSTFQSHIDLSFVNIAAIAQKDAGEILKLLELVLLCAVNSEKNEEVIGHIAPEEDSAPVFNDSEQKQLMFVIQDVTARYNKELGGRASSDSTLGSSLDVASPHASVRAPRTPGSHDPDTEQLRSTVKKLTNEKSDLQEKMDACTRELRDLRLEKSKIAAQLEQKQGDVDTRLRTAVQDAVDRTKKECEEQFAREAREKAYKAVELADQNTQELSDEIGKLGEQLEREKRARADEQARWKAEKRAVQDELDVANEKSKRLAQAEATLERYKKKLEEVEGVAASLKGSDSSTRDLERIVALENQVKEIPNLQAQIAKYRSRVVSLEAELVDLKASDQRHQQELSTLQEELLHAKKERSAVASDLATTKAQLEAMKKEPTAPNIMKMSLRDELPADIKEKLVRLEIENKQLKESGSGTATFADLKDELDITKQISKTHEDKYLQAQRRVHELEKDLASSERRESDMRTTIEQSKNHEEEISRLSREVEYLNDELRRAQKSSSPSAGGATDAPGALNEEVQALQTRNKKLELFVTTLKKKVKDMEDKLGKSASAQNTYSEAVNTLKKQIHDRDIELKEREKIRQEERLAAQREQRLMASAFYSLGMEFQSCLMTGKAKAKRGASRAWINQQRDMHATT